MTDAKTILFQDSLADIVRQLRNSKKSEQDTIQEGIAGVKQELGSTVQRVKVIAVVKLTYFAMLGYPGDYGSFNIIEVMADASFANKRTGYVAAAVTLTETTPVLPLCTALLKRDLMSQNQYEVGLALYCLSCVCSPDLARDLVSDVVALTGNPKAYVRKKATLCLYKIFLQYPDALRPAYPKLKEKLEDGTEKADNDPSVRGAVVNVLCELARRNPANFLNLVPDFYSLLSTMHNNWSLIKVIKVFGYFAPLEPRLGKKLVEPITNLITTSHAKSVQYECLYAVANGMSKVSGLTKLVVEKMKVFVEDRDPNLKYLGLDAMDRVMRDNPKLLADQRETILKCLDDRDVTIRKKALSILQRMTTKKNLLHTVNAMFDRVVQVVPDEEWSNLAIATIVDTIGFDDYIHLQDFEWYIAVLMDLAQVALDRFEHGDRLEQEFVTILTRVSGVRRFGVESLSSLLCNSGILACNANKSNQWRVAKAAAYACSEYPQFLVNKKTTAQQLLASKMLAAPAELQAVAVLAAGKLLSFTAHPCARHAVEADEDDEEGQKADEASQHDDETTVDDLAGLFDAKAATGLGMFCRSIDANVQERAQFVAFLAADNAAADNGVFFAAAIAPVAQDAQLSVEPPAELDLDAAFNDNLPQLVADSDGEIETDSDDDDDESDWSDDDGAAERRAEEQRARKKEVSVFYLAGSPVAAEDGGALPPVEALDMPSAPSRFRSSGKKAHTMSRDLSRPAGYVSPKAARAASEDVVDDAARRLQHINVDKSLGRADVLPTATPYKRQEASPGGTAVDVLAAAMESQRLDEAAFHRVELVASGSLAVTLVVRECKHKSRGGFLLSVSCDVTNSSELNSLYDVVLHAPQAHDADDAVRFVDEHGVSSLSTVLAARVKAEQAANADFDIAFAPLPAMDAPVALRISVKEKKKTREEAVELPLLCKYFMKLTQATSSDTFNTTVLASLSDAVCVAAAVPFPKGKPVKVVLARAAASLRLHVVDTFKNTVSLHGVMPSKKSKPSHVAAILQVEAGEEEGEALLAVSVKGASEPWMSAMITELSNIVAEEFE
jgi:hypothetical protein